MTNDYNEDIDLATAEIIGDDYADVQRLSNETRQLAAGMQRPEVRSIVNGYYQMQQQRIRTAAHFREQVGSNASQSLTEYFMDRTRNLENLYKSALMAYVRNQQVGRWSLSIKGIGPVIAAGLLAHIDIEKAKNVGSLWRFAGQDPTLPKAKKGEKRQYNANLKQLCWLAGESFVKVSKHDDAVYGKMYVIRKEQEIARNESGQFEERALQEAERVGKTTQAYQYNIKGKLAPGHIHARSKRYAVKLFLSHWHYVAFECRYGTPPEKPYILTKPEHSEHFIAPPNWPMD